MTPLNLGYDLVNVDICDKFMVVESIQMDDISIWHYFEISATSRARLVFLRVH